MTRILKDLPIAKVKTRDGFNPRTEFNMDTLDRLAASMKEVGVLQAIEVRPNGADDTYFVIAGERRFIAAGMAGLETIPCLVDDAFQGDEVDPDEIVHALTENLHREDVNPLDEAKAIARLRELGYTSRRQIASKLALPEARIKERELVLDLPESLYPDVAAGSLTLNAVPRLAEIAKLSPELVERCYDLGRNQGWTAKEIADNFGNLVSHASLDGIDIVFIESSVTPDGEDERYSEQARDYIAAYAEKFGYPLHVRLGDDDADAAKAYGCLIEVDGLRAITDLEFAVTRLNDAVLRIQKTHEDNDRYQNETTGAAPPVDPETGKPAETKDRATEIRRAEREERLADQSQAEAYNAELAKQIFERLGDVELDRQVADLLVALACAHDSPEWALRGLRYLHPAWRTEETRKNGSTKVVYLETKGDARERLASFLEAPTPGAKLGRLCQLLLAAHLTDDRAVARSNRVGRGPHATQSSPDGADKAISEGLEHLTKKLTPKMRQGAEEVREAAQAARYGAMGVPQYDDS